MPEWKQVVRQRLAGLNLAPMREAEIVQELAQHLGDRYEELRSGGATEEEACDGVVAELSDGELFTRELRRVERRVTRDPVVLGTQGGNIMGDLSQDLRYAVRTLCKNPGFTLVAVVSLALGIGGNAAIFSIVNHVLIRPLPYTQPDRLVRVTQAYPKGAVVALQEQSQAMEVAAYSTDSEFNLTGQGAAARLVGSQVSANLFTLLGAPAKAGRTFEAGEDRPARDGVVILSHALWRTKFGGDPGIIGRPIAIDGMARQVVGVMPPEFSFPSPKVQVWLPARFDPNSRPEFWEYGWMSLIARAQRTYEMGVRIALGATRSRIFSLVLGQSFRLVLCGLALGMMASLALTRLMTGFLYGVTATDPLNFLVVGILLMAVALLAGYLPALRAATVDPMVALRRE